MTSPLSKIKPNPNVVAQVGIVNNNVIMNSTFQNTKSNPLAVIPKQNVIIPKSLIEDGDVEKLGADLSRSVGQTTEKIISKMSAGKFDELGKILVSIQQEASKLDPTSIKKTGMMGWFQEKFGDIKSELTLRLKNADSVFDNLSEKISDHITVQTEWIKDLELLYTENYQRYEMINKVIEQGESWKTALQNQLDTWPLIDSNDPDAGMKIQAKRDVESRLNRVQIKLDSFLRLKTIAQSNAPKIKTQQDTSRTTVMTLKDVIEQTIPMVKMEFSLFIQSLDAQKSIQIVNSAKTLANTTLIKSADSAKQSAIDAAAALNNPVIQTETLNHIRSRMLETLTEVKQIESNAKQVRLADKTSIEESQKQYLSKLQGN